MAMLDFQCPGVTHITNPTRFPLWVKGHKCLFGNKLAQTANRVDLGGIIILDPN